MAAGLGYKEFATGEVLTAAAANGYLASQVVMVFADAAARTAAITSPQEGMISYLKDTNATQYYSGSAWVSIGGSSSPLTTKGDLYTYSTTDARLGVGANDTVLTADSSTATGLKWAAPAGGGMTLINTGGTTLTGANVSISSIPATYKNLQLIIRNFLPATDNKGIGMRFNSDSNTRYALTFTTGVAAQAFDRTSLDLGYANDNAVGTGLISVAIPDYANTTSWKIATGDVMTVNETTTTSLNYRRGFYAYNQTAAISSITLLPESGNFTSGTAFLYGVQ